MLLHVIFVQRKCRYDGEYAPEAMECADEFTMDENPGYLNDKFEEYRKNTEEFESVQVITISIPDKEITQRLFPSRVPVVGQVQGEDIKTVKI